MRLEKAMKYIYIILLALLVASCSSSRRAVKAPMIGGLTGEAYVEKVIEQTPAWQSLSGKVALDLSLGDGKHAGVNATLRLKRGESIQLSVAPFLGIEVARLEISLDGLLVLDRLNKRYVQVSFEEINRWARTDLSFAVLQSLFFNELFVPGKPQVDLSDANRFHLSLDEGRAMLEAKGGHQLTYRFFTSTGEGWLQESRIGVSGTPYALQWKYDAFRKIEQRFFPEKMRLSIEGASKPLTLAMDFSRLNVGGDWKARTEIPAKYTRVSIEELVKMLQNE